MAGTRIYEGFCARMKATEYQSGVAVLFQVGYERVIHQREDLADIRAFLCVHSQVSPQLGHQQRGAYAMAADVADRDSDAFAGQGYVVKIITSRCIGGK